MASDILKLVADSVAQKSRALDGTSFLRIGGHTFNKTVLTMNNVVDETDPTNWADD